MKKFLMYTVATILAAGGVVGTWYFYPGDVVPVPLSPEVQLENNVADKVVLLDGKRLRMTGLPGKEVKVEETEVGRFVIYTPEEVTEDAMCNLLFSGKPAQVEGQLVPVVPEIASALSKVSQPVAIGVCDHKKKGEVCLWNALFKGADCVLVARSAYYLASDSSELLAMGNEWKARGLQTKREIVAAKEGIEVREEKYEGFKTATDPGDALEVLLTHSWAGLDDLNYQPVHKVCDDEDGQKCSFKKILRYNPNKFVNAANKEEGQKLWDEKLKLEPAKELGEPVAIPVTVEDKTN